MSDIFSAYETPPYPPGNGGWVLVAPGGREVAIMKGRVDTEEIVAMLNEALAARTAFAKRTIAAMGRAVQDQRP